MGISMTIEPSVFKQVMAQWASGVTVVTTMDNGTPLGITVSSFASVSLYPSQILICISHTASIHNALTRSGCFAVHLLKQEQIAWGKRFAGLEPEIDNRFQGIAWNPAETGAPILSGVLCWLDCYAAQAVASGDHTIFVGQVVAAAVSDHEQPLLYYNRAWRHLAQEAPAPTP